MYNSDPICPLGKYKVGMKYSKVNFKHGDSKRQMPKDPNQVSDKDKRLQKSTFVKANDSEDARKGEVLEEHQDHISQLPHDILATILTFLPFREAVRTSVLSRRWKHNWTLNPNLKLLVADILGQHISTIMSLDINSQAYQELVLSNEELGRFLSNCVSLEWMRLTDYPGSKLTINYPSTKLKYLSIFPSLDVEEVEVYSKSLVTFEFHGFWVNSVVVDAPSLVEAWFHVDDHSSVFSRQKLIRLLTCISQLHKLILDYFPFSEYHKLVSNLSQVSSTIINLKVLVLNIRIFPYMDLRWVFSVCPLLQELQLHLYNTHDDESIEVSDHTLTELKVVEISGFFGHQSQIDLVIHLLNHAIVLELLIIHEAKKIYLGEGKWETLSFNLNKSKANSAHKLLLDLVPPNVQLVYNSYDESPC